MANVNFSIFCWNIANPSVERATRQAEWLRKRREDILVLTEAKQSKGCLFLERYFQSYGYDVVFKIPEGKEYGVIIVSKQMLTPSSFSHRIDYLQSRVVATKVNANGIELEIIGVYVPSRDKSYEKTERKKIFLKNLDKVLGLNLININSKRILCGDLNVLEQNHIPRYSFFEKWEYSFYQNLESYNLRDAFRLLNPNVQEYSWVGRTGNGYRYDHCFISNDLLPNLKTCYYFHEPRQYKNRLSDHSALITEFKM